jgi:hypothetical protein
MNDDLWQVEQRYQEMRWRLANSPADQAVDDMRYEIDALALGMFDVVRSYGETKLLGGSGRAGGGEEVARHRRRGKFGQ